MARRRKTSGRRRSPGRVRIVAGKWRGRLLEVGEGETLRPSADRVRETLFNWLAPRIAGAHCLDLFAGSGALGLEALSRDAATVTFVEQDARALRVLERNIDTLLAAAPAPSADIVRADAYAWLEEAPPRLFDLAFLDPPYADESIAELCRLLARQGCLVPDARVFFEQSRATPLALPGDWKIEKESAAGQVRFGLAVHAPDSRGRSRGE